jgi:hypothetical protein
MKDNIYTLTKRAGCLMVVALLTYLSLGGASWACPRQALSKLKHHPYFRNQIQQNYGRAYFLSAEAHDIRTRSPEAITEQERQRGQARAEAAEGYLDRAVKIRAKIQQDRVEAEQEIQQINKESIKLFKKANNQVPDPQTPEGKKYNALQKEASELRSTLIRNDPLVHDESHPYIHRMAEQNSEAYGLTLPPKSATKIK